MNLENVYWDEIPMKNKDASLSEQRDAHSKIGPARIHSVGSRVTLHEENAVDDIDREPFGFKAIGRLAWLPVLHNVGLAP